MTEDKEIGVAHLSCATTTRIFRITMSLHSSTRVELHNNAPGRGRRFILKNLAAEEWTLTIRPGMATLDDLQLHTQEELRVPAAPQQIISHGRSHREHVDGSVHLQHVLPDGPLDYPPVMWLMWLRDGDLCDHRLRGSGL